MFDWCAYDGVFWFRVAGRGLCFTDKRKHPPLFSERLGYRRVIRVRWLGIEWIRKARPSKLQKTKPRDRCRGYYIRPGGPE